MMLSLVVAAVLCPSPQDAAQVQTLAPLSGEPIRDTDGEVLSEASVNVRSVRQFDFDSGVRVILWTEAVGGLSIERYRIRHGEGMAYGRARPAEPQIHLRRGSFDPLVESAPEAPAGLSASGRMHIVQFVTQPIEAYREALRDNGAVVRHFLPEAAHVVEMDAATAEAVEKLPFVRWVGPYRAADRIDETIIEDVASGDMPPMRVHVQVLERGPAMKAAVAARVPALNGTVDWMIEEGFRFDATLNAAGIAAMAAMDEVLWIDPWTPYEDDMDKVRIDGGADALESLTGFTGQGVRGEVMDGNCNIAHPDFQANPIILHGGRSGSESHGTRSTGVVFGDGAGNAQRRGVLPGAQPIFADYGFLNNRYAHTAELLSAAYEAVFQSNSWGSGLTTSYTSTSMQMDDILFDNDIVILQSQSNTGDQDSRPQAWAKNIVSVGGIRHRNTQALDDDAWAGAGSTGPAADGRLKPDLSYWYDSIMTTGENGGTQSFGGTSAATPMTAGYFGLFFQMWHEGVFGNATAGSVFESRPKATLARAFMINTASKYDFSGAGADLRRTTQGWGRANVETLNDARTEMFWVNEDIVLTEGQRVSYSLTVEPGTPELAATLVFLDPAGTTSASVHRINDLSLRLTAPDGQTRYWGNAGLTEGNVSTSGGSSNRRDPVENVFIASPASGDWTVEVFADDINQDGHVETTALDVDFALVVRGTSTTNGDPCLPAQVYCDGDANSVSASGAQVFIFGTNSIAAGDLDLAYASVPPSTFGLMARSMQQASAPVGGGTICIGNPILRMDLVQSDFLGQIYYSVDVTAAAPGGAVAAGETWNYQLWYRDGASSNFSAAVEVTWCD